MKPARLLFAVTLAAAGCADPVHDDLVASLGPEAPGVPPGPLHRPGQPCLACHDGGGPAAMVMSTAGTIFQDGTDTTPMVAATVELTDANQVVTNALTNCAGNFFLQAVDWIPTFPVHVQVSYGSTSSQMRSHMGKAADCASCHSGTDTQNSVVHVYLNFDPMTYPPSGCP